MSLMLGLNEGYILPFEKKFLFEVTSLSLTNTHSQFKNFIGNVNYGRSEYPKSIKLNRKQTYTCKDLTLTLYFLKDFDKSKIKLFLSNKEFDLIDFFVDLLTQKREVETVIVQQENEWDNIKVKGLKFQIMINTDTRLDIFNLDLVDYYKQHLSEITSVDICWDNELIE